MGFAEITIHKIINVFLENFPVGVATTTKRVRLSHPKRSNGGNINPLCSSKLFQAALDVG